ncbi:MAG: hypothetical protein ACTSYD_03575 [Candidatus Heimdallarchaeaceae archaeon]
MNDFVWPIDIISQSPLKQFVLMEMEHERLYYSFIQIDELNEISNRWLEFSKFCANSLSNVTSLSHLLYERFLDEWRRDKEQIEKDPKRNKELTSKIENLQEFQMQSAILMIQYANMVNKGIFGFPPNDSTHAHIDGYRILDQISTTYFDSTHPRASDIEDIMLTLLLLNQKRNLIRLLETTEDVDKLRIIREKAQKEVAQADLSSLFIAELLKILGKDWWWHDPIALHFAYDRTIHDLKEAMSLLTDDPTDPEMLLQVIEKEKLPLVTAKSNFALVEHYECLIFEAAMNNNFKAVVEYSNIILGLEEEAMDLLSKIHDQKKAEALKQEIQEAHKYHKFLHDLGEIAFNMALIINKAVQKEQKSIAEEANSLQEKIETFSSTITVSYLNSVPLTYLASILQIQLALEQGNEPFAAIKNGERVIVAFIKQLTGVFTELMQNLHESLSKNHQRNLTRMKDILENLQYIKIACGFLPEHSMKEDLLNDIKCLEHLVKSYLVENLASEEGINEVLNLIYHAKAYYHASKALEILQLSKLKIIPTNFVERRYSETFVKGEEIELRLFTLTRQYLFLNVVIDKLVLAFRISQSREDYKKNYAEFIKRLFQDFELFELLTKRMTEICTELLNHRQLFHEITDEVNWKAIEARKSFLQSLLSLLEGTKSAILACAANNYKDTYKSISLLDEGAKHINQACEYLKPVAHYDEQFTQLANNSYEYSLFLKEQERKLRDGASIKIELPLNQILSLLKELTFLT